MNARLVSGSTHNAIQSINLGNEVDYHEIVPTAVALGWLSQADVGNAAARSTA